MVKIVLIQSSLRPDARTAVVVAETAKVLRQLDIDHQIIDLRDYTLPFCDGRSLVAYFEEYPDVRYLHEVMVSADGYIFGYPVYLYTISGVLKNFLDILGKSTSGKHFGIIANAGGKNNYMSSNDLINFMLYDFNSTAVMPQVYSYKSHFRQLPDNNWELIDPKPIQKISQMVDTLLARVNRPIRTEV
jgi:NAD(P)H-dependent FMN reductase